MICKWCGNKMSVSDTKCKRCGKEVPALSDCGGFYDIVSEESIAAASAPVAAVNSTFESPVPVTAPAPVTNPLNDKRVKLILVGVVSVFVILLVTVIALAAEVSSLNKELDKAQNEVSVAENEDEDEDDVNKSEEHTETTTTKPGSNSGGTKEPKTETTTTEPEDVTSEPDANLLNEIFGVENLNTDDIDTVTVKLSSGPDDSLDDGEMVEFINWLRTFKLGEEEKNFDPLKATKLSITVNCKNESSLAGKGLYLKENEVYFKKADGNFYKVVCRNLHETLTGLDLNDDEEEPTFPPKDIEKITFRFGDDAYEVKSDDMKKVIDWLKTFNDSDKIDNGLSLNSQNSFSVEIEYEDDKEMVVKVEGTLEKSETSGGFDYDKLVHYPKWSINND